MHPHIYRLMLALVGLAALIAVLVGAFYALNDAETEAAAWASGGTVTLAVIGVFAFLTKLGQGKP